MIEAVFTRDAQGFAGVRVAGHAGYAAHGGDIVCASVTSAVQLCCNGVTEILQVPARVGTDDGIISVTLPQARNAQAEAFLAALHLHLTLLEEQYPAYLKTTVVEV